MDIIRLMRDKEARYGFKMDNYPLWCALVVGFKVVLLGAMTTGIIKLGMWINDYWQDPVLSSGFIMTFICAACGAVATYIDRS